MGILDSAQVSSEGDSLLEKLPEAVRFLALSEDGSLLAAGSVELLLGAVRKQLCIWLEVKTALDQWSANFFCKEPHSTHSWLCRPMVTASTILTLTL